MLPQGKGLHKEELLAEVEALRAELVRLKEREKLSLDALAHDSEISRSTWNRVLQGKSFPPRAAIERLSGRPRLKAQHLVGLWDTADAALKRAAADQAAPPAPDPAIPTASVTAAEPSPANRDAPRNNTPDPTPPASAPSHPDTAPPTGTPAAAPGPPTHAQNPPAAAPAPQAPDTEGTSTRSGDQIATQPSGTPAPKKTSPTRPAPATKTGRNTKLLITFLALVVVLLIARWAAAPDHDTSSSAAPQTSGDTPPADTDIADDGEQGDEKTPTPSGKPPKAESDRNPKDRPAAGPGDTRSPEPGTQTTAPPAGQAPQEDPPGSQTLPSTSPSTAAPSLGEEGRTACAHYKPNRRVILAEGMVGTNVGQVQCLLNHNYGYTLKEDSKFGPDTETAVKAVQRCSGITADGKVGSATWQYLDYPKPACAH
ncbi:peptidoglycan-binding protein [Streptomyces sp. NPDC059783]|uniref:peptidoglycan-binding protein n=1 Tax=Streptomyces sp. NPDC059783 TaxID=3346944 RepID=UPI00365DF2AC